MGVRAEVILYAAEEDTAIAAARAAFDRMNALDDTLSDYRATSELRQLEARSTGAPVPVSADLAAVVNEAIEIAQASEGAFDITVAPLTRVWRNARRMNTLPSPAVVADARKRIGWSRIHVDRADSTISMTPGTQLDLGGIGKGFAVDEAIAVLRASGLSRCLVNLGGDLAAGDSPPDALGWVVDVQSGVSDEPRLRFLLNNSAIATSGDAEQFVLSEDTRFSHILDPRTGEALTRPIAVTVIAPRASTADAWASAISVLGADAGLVHLRNVHGASARIIESDGTTLRITTSPAFPATQ